MKNKIVSLLVLAALLLSLSTGAFATAVAFSIGSDEGMGTLSDGISVGDTLYMLKTDFSEVILQRQTVDMDAPETILEGLTRYARDENDEPLVNTNVDRLFTDGSSLYGYDEQGGSVKLLVDETGAVVNTDSLYTLDRSAIEVNDDGYIDRGESLGMFAQDGVLYTLTLNFADGERYTLIQYDLQTGEVLKQEEQPNLRHIAPYQDGKLLAMCISSDGDYDEQTDTYFPYDIVTFDPQTGEVTTISQSLTHNDTGLVYNQSNGAIYFVSESVVYRLAQGETTPVVSAYLSRSVYGSHTSLLGDKYYVYIEPYDRITVRELDRPDVANGALVLMGDSFSSALDATTKARPDLPIVLSNRYFENAEAMTTAIVSGEDAFDVIRLNTTYDAVEKLIEKGYAADLSAYPSLVETVSSMDANLTSCLFRDGKLYGLPAEIGGSLFEYNKETWEEMLGLTEADLPKTVMELLTFIENFQQDYGEEHADVKLFMNPGYREQLMQLIMEQYVAYQMKTEGIVTFDTPLLRSLLGALEAIDFSEMDPAEALGDDFWQDDEALNEYWQSEFLFSAYMSVNDVMSISGSNQSQTQVPLLMPLDEGVELVIPVQMSVMLVNPRSTRMDMAAEYLTEYAKHYTPKYEGVVLFPQNTDAIPNEDWEHDVKENLDYIQSLEEQLENASEEMKAELREALTYAQEYQQRLEGEKDLVSAQGVQWYHENVSPYLYVQMQTPLSDWSSEGALELQTLMSQYQEGAITLDAYVREMDQRVHMMMLEDM